MNEFKFHKFIFIFVSLYLIHGIVSRPTNEERQDNFDERGIHLEGDMILQSGMNHRAGIVGKQFRWPNATVVYKIDVDFDETAHSRILAAMAEIEEKTCIQFRERIGEIAYVFINKGGAGSGCSSLIGRVGVAQQLNLESPGCVTKGITIHELLHAIGFYHEQSREDRDEFVTINWSNVKIGLEFNFLKAIGSLTYNVTYDYGSIMHYSAYSFANDPSIPTIIPLDPEATIGQRIGLSDKDAFKVNEMYCPKSTRYDHIRVPT